MRPWSGRFLMRSSCLRNEMDCLELCMAYNKSRAGSARRKSEASSRKCLVSLSSIFFHTADYVIAFVIAPYRRIYIAGSVMQFVPCVIFPRNQGQLMFFRDLEAERENFRLVKQ